MKVMGKRFAASLLCLCLMLTMAMPAVWAEEPENGTMLEDETWNACYDSGSVVILGAKADLSGEVIIPDQIQGYGVSNIAGSALKGMAAITAAVIPEGVQYIGTDTFTDCTGLTYVVVPESLLSFGAISFGNCLALTDVYYAGTESQWSSLIAPLDSADALKANGVTVHYGSTGPEQSSPAYACADNADGTVTITGLKEDVMLTGALVIPESINGKTVSAIGERAFQWQEEVTSLEIPASVKKIGVAAFNGMYGLTELILHEGLEVIEDVAFYQSGNYAVTIPASVTSIGVSNFVKGDVTGIAVAEGNTAYKAESNTLLTIDGKTVLAYATGASRCNYAVPEGVTTVAQDAYHGARFYSFHMPASVSSIHSEAFYNVRWNALTVDNANTAYKAVDNTLFSKDGKTLVAFRNPNVQYYTVPNGVTALADNAFTQTSWLNCVYLPEGLTTLGVESMAYSGITKVNLPSTVTTISPLAFWCDDNLTTVSIPVSVTEIPMEAFGNCDNLTDVYYGGTEAQWSSIIIDEYNEPLADAEIHYGTGSLPDTKTTVSIHFQKPDEWADSINAWIWMEDNGDVYDLPGYEAYHIEWPGKAVSENAEHAGWYDFEAVTMDPLSFYFIFNDGNGNQTADLYTGDVTGGLELWVVDGEIHTEEQWGQETAVPSPEDCDVNGDGTVSIQDALVVANAVAGKETLSDEQAAVADLNGSGKVEVADLAKLLNYITGELESLS